MTEETAMSQDILWKVVIFSWSWNTLCSQRSAAGQIPDPAESTCLHLLQHPFYYYSPISRWLPPNDVFLGGFPENIKNAVLISLLSTTRTYNFDSIAQTVFCAEYKLWSSILCMSLLLFLLFSLCSRTLSTCVLPFEWETKFHTHIMSVLVLYKHITVVLHERMLWLNMGSVGLWHSGRDLQVRH
jgi:hypothetical protein